MHELDYFCSVDMSATYLDILKDRLYTFRADSPLRRGSQMVLFQIVTGLARLMAPILSFYRGRRVGRRAGQRNVSGDR